VLEGMGYRAGHVCVRLKSSYFERKKKKWRGMIPHRVLGIICLSASSSSGRHLKFVKLVSYVWGWHSASGLLPLTSGRKDRKTGFAWALKYCTN